MSSLSRPATAPRFLSLHDDQASAIELANRAAEKAALECAMLADLDNRNPFADACQQLEGFEDISMAIEATSPEDVELSHALPQTSLSSIDDNLTSLQPETQPVLLLPEPTHSVLQQTEPPQNDTESALDQKHQSPSLDTEPVSSLGALPGPPIGPLLDPLDSLSTTPTPAPLNEDFCLESIRMTTATRSAEPPRLPFNKVALELRPYQR